MKWTEPCSPTNEVISPAGPHPIGSKFIEFLASDKKEVKRYPGLEKLLSTGFESLGSIRP